MLTTSSSAALSFRQRAVLWVSLAFVLMVSSAQAAHVCGTNGLDLSHSAQASVAQSFGSPEGPCLICSSSQPATSPIAFAGWVPQMACVEAGSTELRLAPRSGEQLSLYIRPPPSL